MNRLIKISVTLIFVLFSIFSVTYQAQSQDNDLIDETTYLFFLPLIMTSGVPPCSLRPTLISPANSTTLETIAPVFHWDNGIDSSITSVILQVASDPAFTENLRTLDYSTGFGEKQHQFDTNFETGTQYYWRTWLKCQDDTLASPSSPVWTFTTPAEATVLDAPTLLEPANEEEVAECPVDLKWEAVDDAMRYRIRYSDAADGFDTSWTFIEIEETEYAFPCQDYDDETITWAVTAIGAQAIGTESGPWTFDTPEADSNDLSVPGGTTHFFIEEDGTINRFDSVP